MYYKFITFILLNTWVSVTNGLAINQQSNGGQSILSTVFVTKIFSSTNEFYLNENDLFEIECTGLKNLTFDYPSKRMDIISSPIEIQYHYIEGRYKTVLRRKKTVFGDTGWYSCLDLDKFRNSPFNNRFRMDLTPDNYKDPDVKWIYVYVKSNNVAFVNPLNKMTSLRAEVGDDIRLPCRINSPDHQVAFYHEYERLELNERLSYDPRKGLLIKNITLADSGLYDCFNNKYYNKVSYILHVTTDLYNPVISNYSRGHLLPGDKLQLNCTVEITYGLSYSLEWKTPHTSDRISSHSYYIEGDFDSFIIVNQLTVEGITSEDEGEYECVVSSHRKKNSAKVNVRLEKTESKNGHNCFCNETELSTAIDKIKKSIVSDFKLGINKIISGTVGNSVTKVLEYDLESIQSKLESVLRFVDSF
ncbi:vascular endothelial growth factor receptor 2-like isoform X2 [Microplitis demolitor]|uniref:vascular endothelial growth factor receptor 2-like isoform X2 n=1 Tax=Microplitis demolitor TaxID=69319 RepID=UPI0004CCFD18|nr:vascular endothelial growth factor receptor 2-like isoform X2 [Microplitis demolitor]